MKRKFFFLLPFVLTIFSIAQEDECESCSQAATDSQVITEDSTQEKPAISYGQGHSAEQMNAGFNFPARYDVKNCTDFYFTGSFIYWQAKEKGLEVCEYDLITNATGPKTESKTIFLDYDFEPGFKIGAGYNINRDDWYVYMEYIRHSSSCSGKKSITNTSTEDLETVWDFQDESNTYTSMKGRWKQYLNLLDFELGRAYYVGEKLTFKPFVGARLGFIDQKYKMTMITDSNIYIYADSKLDSWLLGPRIGLKTNWLLGEGFRLFTNAAGCIFYQDFDLHSKKMKPVQTGVTDLKEEKYSLDKGYINPSIEAALGFGWGCYFSDEQWHIDLSAAYEFYYFWEQNLFVSAALDLPPGVVADTESLTYNGLTVSLQLDF